MAELSLEQVTDRVIDGIVKDPAALNRFAAAIPIDKLMDTESGKSWQARAISAQIANVQAKLDAEVELRTKAERDTAELMGKLERREQYERQYGMHVDNHGRVRSNISPESEKFLGEFTRAYMSGGMAAARALNTGTAGAGAEFIPTAVANEVIRLVPEVSLYAQIARPWPMTSTKQDIGSIVSKVQAYWPGEGQPATPSYPTTDKCALQAKELVGYTELPLALIEDATIPIGQVMSDMLVEAIGVELTRVGLVGKSVADGGTDAHTGAMFADMVNMLKMGKGQTGLTQIEWRHFSRLTVTPPEGATDDCSFIVSPTLLNWAMEAADKFGRPIWKAPGDAHPGTICGRPYHTSYRMPALPAVDDDGNYPASPSTRISLYGNWGKFSFYGLRSELRVDMSNEAGDNFKNRTVGIRAFTRGGVATFGPGVAVLETATK